MIIVVEGPSAAGKTTFARQFGPEVLVHESQGLAPPRGGSPSALAKFWLAADSNRWTKAEAIERRMGTAVCDTDPLKLHYHFCLFRLGAVDHQLVDAGVVAYRRAIDHRQVGIADLILCAVPDEATIVDRKLRDTTRRRRNFDLHRRLAEPLEEWYSALDEADPGRVMWGFPSDPPTQSREHFDTDLFDQWMSRLGLVDQPRR